MDGWSRRFFFGRADKDELEYRIYVLGSQEAELTADGLVDILKVALVVCRDDDGLDPGAQRAHGLFTQPAYRQDTAAQGDLAGPGDHRAARADPTARR